MRYDGAAERKIVLDSVCSNTTYSLYIYIYIYILVAFSHINFFHIRASGFALFYVERIPLFFVHSFYKKKFGNLQFVDSAKRIEIIDIRLKTCRFKKKKASILTVTIRWIWNGKRYDAWNLYTFSQSEKRYSHEISNTTKRQKRWEKIKILRRRRGRRSKRRRKARAR